MAKKKARVSYSLASASMLVQQKAFTLLTATNAFTRDATELKGLRRLHRAIAREGLSRPLVAFVSTPELRRIVSIPSVETLDIMAVSPTSSRAKKTLATLRIAIESETDAVKGFVETAASQIDELLTQAGDEAERFKGMYAHITQDLEGLQNYTHLEEKRVTAKTAEARIKICMALKNAVSLIGPPSVLSDPDHRKSLADSFTVMAEKLAPVLGTTYVNGVFGIDDSVAADEYQAQEGTLLDLGYSISACTQLTESASALIGAVEALVAQKGAIVERLGALTTELPTQTVDTADGPKGMGLNTSDADPVNPDQLAEQVGEDDPDGLSQEDHADEVVTSDLDETRALITTYTSLIGVLVQQSSLCLADTAATLDNVVG